VRTVCFENRNLHISHKKSCIMRHHANCKCINYNELSDLITGSILTDSAQEGGANLQLPVAQRTDAQSGLGKDQVETVSTDNVETPVATAHTGAHAQASTRTKVEPGRSRNGQISCEKEKTSREVVATDRFDG
jgi:hypothetical protein